MQEPTPSLPRATTRSPRILSVEGLTVGFAMGAGVVPVLRDVSLTIERAETLALVGESGSGKTLTALAIGGLLPPAARVLAGRIELTGRGDLLALEPGAWRQVRGRRIAMIFQDPSAALNPVLKIGDQIAEGLRQHRALGRRAARREALELLEMVALPDPARRLESYPHQLSGGQRQRVMIAMAIGCRPDLLIADEPTTALDVTLQAQMLELLDSLRRRLELAILLITHDLGVVAQCADRVAVMYAGEIVEQAHAQDLFRRPEHPYTMALLRSVPLLRGGRSMGFEGIPGQVPEPGSLPSGCSFHPRCPRVMDLCRRQVPELYRVAALAESSPPRLSRCFLHFDEGEA